MVESLYSDLGCSRLYTYVPDTLKVEVCRSVSDTPKNVAIYTFAHGVYIGVSDTLHFLQCMG